MKFSLYCILVALATASYAQDRVIIQRSPVVKIYTGPRHNFSRGADRIVVHVRDVRVVNTRHVERHYQYNRHAYRNIRNFAWNIRNSAFVVRDRTRNGLRRME